MQTTGTIAEVESKTAKTGKEYKRVKIDGKWYTVFDLKLHPFCQLNMQVAYEFEENGEFKNIKAIVPLGASTTPVNTSSARRPNDDRMVRMNALNNSVSLLKLMQDAGIKLDSEPEKIANLITLAQSVAKEFIKFIENKDETVEA